MSPSLGVAGDQLGMLCVCRRADDARACTEMVVMGECFYYLVRKWRTLGPACVSRRAEVYLAWLVVPAFLRLYFIRNKNQIAPSELQRR